MRASPGRAPAGNREAPPRTRLRPAWFARTRPRGAFTLTRRQHCSLVKELCTRGRPIRPVQPVRPVRRGRHSTPPPTRVKPSPTPPATPDLT
jgi:hypothetical protein